MVAKPFHEDSAAAAPEALTRLGLVWALGAIPGGVAAHDLWQVNSGAPFVPVMLETLPYPLGAILFSERGRTGPFPANHHPIAVCLISRIQFDPVSNAFCYYPAMSRPLRAVACVFVGITTVASMVVYQHYSREPPNGAVTMAVTTAATLLTWLVTGLD